MSSASNQRWIHILIITTIMAASYAQDGKYIVDVIRVFYRLRLHFFTVCMVNPEKSRIELFQFFELH